jgi:hypothetical protein
VAACPKQFQVFHLWPQRNATLSVGSLLRRSYLLYFSQPAADRAVYKAVTACKVRAIVEIGIGLAGRTRRLLEIAGWRRDCLPLRYTGIDLFEARPSHCPGVPLKQAFAQLRLPNVKVQLVPGDPYSALRRVANALAGTDLLLIAGDQDPESLARAWTWLPRMLTPQSLIFVEEPAAKAGQTCWRPLTFQEIERRASSASRAHRRAA